MLKTTKGYTCMNMIIKMYVTCGFRLQGLYKWCSYAKRLWDPWRWGCGHICHWTHVTFVPWNQGTAFYSSCHDVCCLYRTKQSSLWTTQDISRLSRTGIKCNSDTNKICFIHFYNVPVNCPIGVVIICLKILKIYEILKYNTEL